MECPRNIVDITLRESRFTESPNINVMRIKTGIKFKFGSMPLSNRVYKRHFKWMTDISRGLCSTNTQSYNTNVYQYFNVLETRKILYHFQ